MELMIINTGSVETFLRSAEDVLILLKAVFLSLFPPGWAPCTQKAVEFYIDLLQSDQLDEKVPVTNLENSVAYFETVYPVHLSDQRTDCPSFMADHTKLLAAGVDYVTIEVKRIKS